MTRARWWQACLSSMALLLVAGLSAQAHELWAGSAAVKITPPEGAPMAGYYDARAADGVHDDLFAKALVLDSGGTRAALIVLDLISTSRDLVEEARAAVEAATGIPASHVMISATHAHTGPVLASAGARSGDFGGASEIAKAYRKELPGLIAQSVKQAVDKLQPARAFSTVGHESSIAFNRRFHMTDGSVGWNPGKLNPKIVKPAGPIDPEVPIVYFEGVGDEAVRKPIATYVNYAVHLDNVGGLKISADLPGVLSQMMAQVKGPEMVTLWSAGCCGDINHINVRDANPQKGFDNAARMGIILAAEVMRSWPRLKPVSDGPLRVKSAMVRLPLPAVSEADIAEAGEVIARRKSSEGPKPTFLESVKAYQVLDVAGREGKPTEAEVQVITLGRDLAWVSLPGEMFVELGLSLKQSSPFGMTIPVELANGSVGYVPTQRAYPQGNYEVISARVAEGSGESLIAAASRLLHEIFAAEPEVTAGK